MKSKMIFVSFFSILLAVACSPTVETANPVETIETEENNTTQSNQIESDSGVVDESGNSEAGSVAQSNLPFEDDYSNPNSGWDRAEWEEGFTDYVDGAYRMFVVPENYSIWANPGLHFIDTSVTVVATKSSGHDDNEFGIICRYADIENFYAVTVSSDGFYGFLNIEDGTYGYLNMEEMQPTAAIVQGNSTNTIRLDCIGNTLTLYVNGEYVAERVDDRIQSGDVGLYAGTFAVPGTEILFDDFVVTAP
jgi:hypothetical protein